MDPETLLITNIVTLILFITSEILSLTPNSPNGVALGLQVIAKGIQAGLKNGGEL